MTVIGWTCTTWGMSPRELEAAVRDAGSASHIRFDEPAEHGSHLVHIERAPGTSLLRARTAKRLPISARELSKVLVGTCVVETSFYEESVPWPSIEMATLGALAFREGRNEEGESIHVGASTMRIVVSDGAELRHVRAMVRASLAQRLGAHVGEMLGLADDGNWTVTPGVEWAEVATLRCRDPKSHADRLFDAALANAPPGLAEAAGWPAQEGRHRE